MKVSCLGPLESYSCLAAKRFQPNAEYVCCKSFTEVVEKLQCGEVDFAVLPVSNLITGSIIKNFDLIIQTKEIMGVASYALPIRHHLVTKGKIPYEKIERVCSHPQALSQCEKFLSATFPRAKLVVTQSTAESLSLLDEHTAGIVGDHASGEGLVFSEENIADEQDNVTIFLLFEKRTQLPEKSNYFLFSVVCGNQAGRLASFLGIFADLGMNLTRISSRPVQSADGPYRFFMEFQGNIADDSVQSALAEAERQGGQFRLIGAYN